MSNRKRLLIASPAKGNLPHAFMLLYQRLTQIGLKGWDITVVTEAQQNAINISRNILADYAVKHNFDRIIMRDLDNPADLHHFELLLRHDHEQFPIVSGLYCIKKPGDPFWLGMTPRGAKPDEEGRLEANFLPTGFLSISVDALRKIAAFHQDREFYVQKQEVTEDIGLTPTPIATGETMTEFFPVGVNGPRTASARLRRIKELLHPGRIIPDGAAPQLIGDILAAITEPHTPGYYTGEDYFFSLLAHQAGVKQYIDTKCLIGHRGAVDFPLTDPNVLPRKINPVPHHEADISKW